MKTCEYCGGACGKTVRLVASDGVRSFDCVECALAALYPACESCGTALQNGQGESYCSDVCAGRIASAA